VSSREKQTRGKERCQARIFGSSICPKKGIGASQGINFVLENNRGMEVSGI